MSGCLRSSPAVAIPGLSPRAEQLLALLWPRHKCLAADTWGLVALGVADNRLSKGLHGLKPRGFLPQGELSFTRPKARTAVERQTCWP